MSRVSNEKAWAGGSRKVEPVMTGSVERFVTNFLWLVGLPLNLTELDGIEESNFQ